MRFVANSKIRICGNRNFALIKPCQLHFLGNPHWNNLVKNLKEYIHDGKNKDDVGHNADKLGDKLGCVAIKQPFDRSRHSPPASEEPALNPNHPKARMKHPVSALGM